MLDVSAEQRILKRTRLVIVDRQPIVRQGLKSVFGSQRDFDVVASCSDGTSCLEAIRNLTPDVALIADSLPDLTVSGILATAKAENLSTRLVFFTESESDHDLAAAIAAGACSEISKYASPDTMLRLLRLLTKRSVSPEQFDLSLADKEADGGAKIEKMLELLTHRERQIVRLVSEGMSNKEIARQLTVSPGTVKVHLYNIFQKLEITNRTVLATLALLQRPSGFGTLALAFLAAAIADELKAAEANDMLPNDGSIGHAGEHAEYEPWKKAILRHLIVWESAETPPLTQREFFAKLSQVTSPAAVTEALRAAEQSVGAKSWKDDGPVGSSAPNLPTPSLRGISDTRIGADPAPENQFPPLASKPMLIQGGYGTFATVAGALIYALQDPHLAVQAHDPNQASIDSFVAVTGENATTKLAAITNADANHVESSASGFAAHDFRLPSASVATENAGDNLQKPPDLVDFRHETSIGGYGRDQAMGGNVGEHVVYRSSIDSNLTSSDAVFDFASGSSRINLAAFGALAWLHMTAASKSIPPRTVAWTYDAVSNETIVYVNPTDRTLDLGDRGLLEFHLQGIVAIAEADFVSQPDGTAVAATLEQLEALISAKAADETVLSTDDTHAVAGTSESTLGMAGVWSVLADAGLSFQFGQTRTGSGASTRFRTFTSDSTDATAESADAPGVSAHVLSIELAQSATVPAVENPALKSEPINADTGDLSTGQNETVEPSAATADSAERGNSQHASEQGSAKAATEMAEEKSSPGNGVGHDKEHHSQASDGSTGSKKTAEPGDVEHGNSGHLASAKAPEAEIASTADSAERGNSQHASEQGSAKAATETAEAKSSPGNGVGHDKEHHSEASDGSPGSKKTAEPGGVEHGNSGHSTSAKAPEAAEIAATADSADRGNAHHASEPGSAKTATTDLAEADFISGKGVGKGAEHRSPASDAANASAIVKTAEPAAVEHGNSGHDLPSISADASGAEIVKASGARGDHAGHGNSQQVAPSAAIALEPAQPAKAASETGGADRELVFRFDREGAPAALVAAVKPKELHHPLDPHVPPGQQADLEMIVKAFPNGLDEHAANHSNNGAHHAIVPAPHDLLI